MDNLLTYLKWRGDTSFIERPFCEVDNLVLSAAIYFDFSGLIPANNEEVLLGDIRELMSLPEDSKAAMVSVVREMAKSRRFRSVRLCQYRQLTDEI